MKIYLCIPYSHIDPDVRHQRFDTANRGAAKLIKEGHVVFSPISHSHPIAPYIGNPNNSAFWVAQDLSFIEWCDEMHVICIDGWRESKGIKAEMAEANRLGKTIVLKKL